jgi:hypothetical protein
MATQKAHDDPPGGPIVGLLVWKVRRLASGFFFSPLILRILANAAHFIPLPAPPVRIFILPLATGRLIFFLATARHLVTALLRVQVVTSLLFCHDSSPPLLFLELVGDKFENQ